MPKRNCTVCENAKKNLFCQKKFPFWYYGHIKTVLTTLPKKNSPEGRKFLAHFWKKITHTDFSTEYFPSKISCGNVHFSFGNPAGSLLTKNWKNSLKERKLWKKYIFFLKKNFTEMILGTCRRLFLQPESFCSMSKNDKMFLFPTNSPLKISIETWNAVFSHLHKKSCRKAEFFSGLVPKKYTKPRYKFFKNCFWPNVPMDT